jgi:hypothetical protein
MKWITDEWMCLDRADVDNLVARDNTHVAERCGRSQLHCNFAWRSVTLRRYMTADSHHRYVSLGDGCRGL